MKNRNIELLIPAGGQEQFLAAVENGADAIYVGGQFFNARAGAQNFDNEELLMVLDYAHKRGVKVFVTMNTLLSDEELEPALRYAEFLNRAGVDALIIQDYGFGSLIKEYLPEMEMHLSTQATITDLKGARTAQELGYKRVVVARELSLGEIREIANDGDFEVEAFVHGAICVCYSGQCQYSRYYGGRSGNLGSCAQPCRLAYKSFDKNDKEIAAPSHVMSPRDMCLLDDLGELIEAGVSSLKIEGRMKSAEYVAIVTSIYRKYIDMYMETGKIEVSAEDREDLLQIFNRGEFTSEYLKGRSGEALMSGEIAKNQGVKIGRVKRTKAGSTLVDMELTEVLAIGDGIEIYGDDSKAKASTVVSYCKELGRGITRVGDIKGHVKPMDTVYRTSQKSLLEKARRTYTGVDFGGEDKRKNKRRRKINMNLSVETGTLKLKACTLADENSKRWPSLRQYETIVAMDSLAEVTENATPKERYEGALSKTGTTPFALNNLELEGKFNLKVKASELNALRRKCLENLEDKMRFRRAETDLENAFNFLRQASLVKKAVNDDVFEIHFNDINEYFEENFDETIRQLVSRVAELDEDKIRILLPAAGLMGVRQKNNKDFPLNIYPYIGAVTRGKEEQILNDNYEELLELCKDRKIYVGHLGWLKRLVDEGVNVIADFGLNAYNGVSLGVLLNLGADSVIWSLEKAGKEQGRYPLMTTEHIFKMHRIKGKRGHDVRILNRDFSSQSLVIPSREKLDIVYLVKRCINSGYTRIYI